MLKECSGSAGVVRRGWVQCARGRAAQRHFECPGLAFQHRPEILMRKKLRYVFLRNWFLVLRNVVVRSYEFSLAINSLKRLEDWIKDSHSSTSNQRQTTFHLHFFKKAFLMIFNRVNTY